MFLLAVNAGIGNRGNMVQYRVAWLVHLFNIKKIDSLPYLISIYKYILARLPRVLTWVLFIAIKMIQVTRAFVHRYAQPKVPRSGSVGKFRLYPHKPAHEVTATDKRLPIVHQSVQSCNSFSTQNGQKFCRIVIKCQQNLTSIECRHSLPDSSPVFWLSMHWIFEIYFLNWLLASKNILVLLPNHSRSVI